VLAAAQTAAAAALRQSLTDTTLSEQDFYFCRNSATDEFQKRGCSSGWSIKEGMVAFAALQKAKQLPVVEACRPYNPADTSPCSRTCETTLPQLLQGRYAYQRLGSIVEMQRHIREHGSIVCRMQLYSDIKPFFDANRGGVYKRPGAWWGSACVEGRHAGRCLPDACWSPARPWALRARCRGFARHDGGMMVVISHHHTPPHTISHQHTPPHLLLLMLLVCSPRSPSGGSPRSAGGGV
jgi:hypothetical protein